MTPAEQELISLVAALSCAAATYSALTTLYFATRNPFYIRHICCARDICIALEDARHLLEKRVQEKEGCDD